MGRFTVNLILAIMLLLTIPGLALAQEPTPTTIPLPYDFEPMDYASATPVISLDIAGDAETVNSMGSVVVTVWAMLDNWAGGGVLGIFVVFLMGLIVIRWVAGFVYNKPIKGPEVEVSKAADIAGELSTDKYSKQWAQFGRELARRKRPF